MKRSRWILLIIVFAQFCCTSLWFAGNGVMTSLIENFGLKETALGHLTSAVQFGFIAGTLVFAMLTIADRFSPSKVFFASAVLGAIFNALIIFEWNVFISLIILRFITGFFLAGIYPVGMKIAADYYNKGLGLSLGFLVGALVIGTAFPHLLKGFSGDLPWRFVILSTSFLSCTGGLIMILLVPNGPYRKSGHALDFSAFLDVFRDQNFKSAAFGYFGHMWELYAFWAFIPLILGTYKDLHPNILLNIPLLSFTIIGIGGISCIVGGFISLKVGVKNTAFAALFLSCICCLLSPLVFMLDSALILIAFLIFWGMVVVADSPLFSTLIARNVRAETKGTALTIVNCIGFSITIISIQFLSILQDLMNPKMVYMILAVGPLVGLILMYKNRPEPNISTA